MTDPNDILFGSSVPAASFNQLGAWVSGQIVSLGSAQQTEYRKPGSTGPVKKLTWPDGQPMMQVIVTLQTTQRDPSVADDDGQRRVFVKGKRLTNGVREAVRAAGARKLELGGTLTVKWVGEEDTGAGSPAKVYDVTYTRPQPGVEAANQALGMAQPQYDQGGLLPQQPVQQQPVQQQPVPAAAPQQQQLDVTNLSPEAAAIVQQMIAQQQQQAGVQTGAQS